MDFTPGAFQRVGLRPNSDAAEVGLAVAYESGLQMFAGTPESYDARPLARAFFDQVPAAWDDTRLLAGQPGQEAVLARRSGDRWFLGGVYAGAARTAEVPLSLGPGRWLVETIRDGADGLVQDRRVLRGGDTLHRRRRRQRRLRRHRLPLAPGGHHLLPLRTTPDWSRRPRTEARDTRATLVTRGAFRRWPRVAPVRRTRPGTRGVQRIPSSPRRYVPCAPSSAGSTTVSPHRRF